MFIIFHYFDKFLKELKQAKVIFVEKCFSKKILKKILKNRNVGSRNRSFLTSDFDISISKCKLHVPHGEANRKNLTVLYVLYVSKYAPG